MNGCWMRTLPSCGLFFIVCKYFQSLSSRKSLYHCYLLLQRWACKVGCRRWPWAVWSWTPVGWATTALTSWEWTPRREEGLARAVQKVEQHLPWMDQHRGSEGETGKVTGSSHWQRRLGAWGRQQCGWQLWADVQDSICQPFTPVRSGLPRLLWAFSRTDHNYNNG